MTKPGDFLLFVIASLLVISTNIGFACSCVEPGTPIQELQSATAVFSGKVIQIDEVNIDWFGGQVPGYQVKFDVEKVWKGVSGKTVVISTSRFGASCGYTFKKGESYLVYAHGEKDALQTNICTRTKKLAAAQEDLRELGPAAVAPKGKLTTTWGSVKGAR